MNLHEFISNQINEFECEGDKRGLAHVYNHAAATIRGSGLPVSEKKRGLELLKAAKINCERRLRIAA